MSSGMHMSSSRGRTIVCPTGVIIQAGALAAPTSKTIVAGRSNREGRSLPETGLALFQALVLMSKPLVFGAAGQIAVARHPTHVCENAEGVT